MKHIQLSSFALSLLAGVSLTACGGSSGGGEDASVNANPDAAVSAALSSLSITTQPASSVAGDLLTITVEARDADNNLITDATSIALTIETNPGAGTLGGTATQMTSAGIATFTDVFVDKVGVGYTVLATSGTKTVETEAFDISVGALAALGFVAQPANVEAMSPMAAAVTVQLEDAFGNLVADATGDISVRLANNPGQMLAHSSGNGPGMIELLDPVTLLGVGWYESFLSLEARGMLVHPTDGLTYVVDIGSNLLSVDLATDTLVDLGVQGLSPRGLVFDPAGAGRFLALDYVSSDLIEVDLGTFTSTSLGPIVATPAVESFAGMTIDPTTGTFYAIALTTLETVTARRLVTIDPVGLTATEVGTLANDGVSAITFRADGTLLAITGDGGGPARTVYTVDKATAGMTLIATLDNLVGDGEFIAVVPARALGTTTVTPVGGIASFDGLRIDAIGTGYTLEAVSGDLSSAPSAAFDVTALQGIAGTATLDLATQAVSEDVGTVNISASIDLAQTHDVVLTYEVGGDAANDTDSGISDQRFFNITIVAGATSAVRSFAIVDDAVAELDETITLTLVNSAMAAGIGAVLDQTITISDND